MSKERKGKAEEQEMVSEYDFSRGVRGYFSSRVPPGSKIKRLTPAQAKRWLARRKKQREAAVQLESAVRSLATSLKSGAPAQELAAIEEHLQALSAAVQRVADSAGKSAKRPVKEARSEVREIQALLRQFKSQMLRHARELTAE